MNRWRCFWTTRCEAAQSTSRLRPGASDALRWRAFVTGRRRLRADSTDSTDFLPCSLQPWCPSAQLGILHRRCSWRYQGQRVGVLSVNTANLDEPVMLHGKILCFFAFPVSNANSKVWLTVADVACVALLKASLVASLICTLPGFLLQLLAYPLAEL